MGWNRYDGLGNDPNIEKSCEFFSSFMHFPFDDESHRS